MIDLYNQFYNRVFEDIYRGSLREIYEHFRSRLSLKHLDNYSKRGHEYPTTGEALKETLGRKLVDFSGTCHFDKRMGDNCSTILYTLETKLLQSSLAHSSRSKMVITRSMSSYIDTKSYMHTHYGLSTKAKSIVSTTTLLDRCLYFPEVYCYLTPNFTDTENMSILFERVLETYVHVFAKTVVDDYMSEKISKFVKKEQDEYTRHRRSSSQ